MDFKAFAIDNARTEFTSTPAETLQRANDLISYLVNALDCVARADNLPYAKGAAEQAMKHAHSRRTRNRHGYLEVR